ncbi:response regulator [Flavobacterium sp. MXW15]|uniref:histidine kinase n=1 Tax=Xanthomonas chitinilytica TaxID=2989819 RepID=A0ABT3JW15_9XANT|nr:response regulator [Xanthomonas sp. H13-6]MCW4455154.1 response regulator [Flavobacterium sp. MXW15]MCW4472680.1 response regulator [Xanthomonas sp. H13-6]
MAIGAPAWVRQRLAQRQDSEHGQAIVRIVLIVLILSYVMLPTMRMELPDRQYQGVLAIVLGGLTLSVLLFGWLLARPGRSDPRRVAGMLADYGLMAAGMIQMGEPLAWVYIVVMWVTVGNGMRYGNNYLYVAVAMALASFGTTVLLTEYWQQNLRLGLGLLLGLAAVPLYFSTLLRQLTRAMAEAQRASEAKSRFLANMSHEFRTPLNGLSGMSEVLATTRLDDEQRECVSTIQASTRSLLALVEEVLDISAIEAGKLRVNAEDFSLGETLDAIGLILLPQAKSKRLDYRVSIAGDVPDRLRGDAGHLRQILLNLAGNAVKFTDSGSVEIRVGLVAPATDDGARLRFDILDTGIGVPAALRPRLFEAFEQADVSMARRYEGTGLGTTIAKGLAEALGGSVGYAENVPVGSRFWVELPFAAPASAERRHALRRAPAVQLDGPAGDSGNVIAFSDPFLRHRARVRSMQILVADDHEANRMVLQRLLQKAGHRVTCVGGGEAVLDALAEADFDAAIVDLHMPGMSGLDMLKQLRVMQSGGGPRTPVLVLSADVTPEAIQRCIQAGAHAFLAKPVVAARLLDTLADIASNGRLGAGVPIVRAPVASDSVLDPGVLDELASLGMGEGFEREFIRQCLNDADGCLGGIAHAAESGNWERLREHAHAIKGVASNLGLVRLAAQGGEMMRMADWQLKAEWRQRHAQLNASLSEGRLALDARARQQAQHRGDGDAQ